MGGDSLDLGGVGYDIELRKQEKFHEGLDKAETHSKSAVQTMLDTFMKLGDVAFAFNQIKQAADTVFGALKDFAMQAREIIDDTSDMANSIGVSTDQLFGMEQAFANVGVGADMLQAKVGGLAAKAMADLEAKARAAAAGVAAPISAFDRLGVSVTDASGQLKTSGQLFIEVGDALARLGPSGNTAALATELLGKGATRMLPAFADLKATMAEVAKETNILGLNFTELDQKRANALEGAIGRLNRVTKGFIVTLGAPFIESLTTITGALASLGVSTMELIKSSGALETVIGVLTAPFERRGAVLKTIAVHTKNWVEGNYALITVNGKTINLMEGASGAYQKAATSGGILNTVIDGMKSLLQGVADIAATVWEWAGRVGAGFLEWAQRTAILQTAFDLLKSGLGGIQQAIEYVFGKLVEYRPQIENALLIFTLLLPAAIAGLGTAFRALLPAAVEVQGSISGVGTAAEVLTGFAGRATTSLKSFFSGTTTWKDGANILKGGLQGAASGAASLAKSTADVVKGQTPLRVALVSISPILGTVLTAFERVGAGMIAAFRDPITWIKASKTSLVEWFASTRYGTQIMEAFSGVATAVSRAVSGIAAGFTTAGGYAALLWAGLALGGGILAKSGTDFMTFEGFLTGVAAAVGALVVGFVVLSGVFYLIAAGLAAVSQMFGDFYGTVIDGFDGTFSGFVGKLVDWWGDVYKELGDILEGALYWVGELLDLIWDYVTPWFSELWDSILGTFRGWTTDMGNAASSMWSSMTAGVSEFASSIYSKLGSAFAWVQSKASVLLHPIDAIQQYASKFGGGSMIYSYAGQGGGGAGGGVYAPSYSQGDTINVYGDMNSGPDALNAFARNYHAAKNRRMI